MSSLAEFKKKGRQMRKHNNEDSLGVYFKTPTNQLLESQPLNIVEFDPPTFEVLDDKMRSYLDENGYVVIRNVISHCDIILAEQLLWKFLISKTEMERENSSTWTNENFQTIGSAMTGIINKQGFGQSEFQWYLRGLPSKYIVACFFLFIKIEYVHRN